MDLIFYLMMTIYMVAVYIRKYLTHPNPPIYFPNH